MPLVFCCCLLPPAAVLFRLPLQQNGLQSCGPREAFAAMKPATGAVCARAALLLLLLLLQLSPQQRAPLATVAAIAAGGVLPLKKGAGFRVYGSRFRV